MQETLNSKKSGDSAFRAKEFATAIDSYTQVSLCLGIILNWYIELCFLLTSYRTQHIATFKKWHSIWIFSFSFSVHI